ncbi:hypothetical protein M427DRAFT_153595 [Gonapodya prolifera JEL478]|uniref:F-box domain-containing protein n=1 Tax=Gonapodya prolifera (strain JEL478) TaxID=1344416 RepID=A0A139ALN3_GONPJ|nr:hypothetical protein M427DRAFT_153595 [Gonapodya prolifera JEL478]|eukprot:KXS17696.1 hypothetical protein M427DRAFT_153595 [Gonapodya prolifera JEL478]
MAPPNRRLKRPRESDPTQSVVPDGRTDDHAPSLSSLPPELTARIMEWIDPSTLYLTLPCVSRLVRASASMVLSRYSVIVDVEVPMSPPHTTLTDLPRVYSVLARTPRGEPSAIAYPATPGRRDRCWGPCSILDKVETHRSGDGRDRKYALEVKATVNSAWVTSNHGRWDGALREELARACSSRGALPGIFRPIRRLSFTGGSDSFLDVARVWWLLVRSFQPMRLLFNSGVSKWAEPDENGTGDSVSVLELTRDYNWAIHFGRALEYFPNVTSVLKDSFVQSPFEKIAAPRVRSFCTTLVITPRRTLCNLPLVEKLGYMTSDVASATDDDGTLLVRTHLRKLGIRWCRSNVKSLKKLVKMAPLAFPNLESLDLVLASMGRVAWNWVDVRQELCQLAQSMNGKLKVVILRVAEGSQHIGGHKSESVKLKVDLQNFGVRCVVVENPNITEYDFESDALCV